MRLLRYDMITIRNAKKTDAGIIASLIIEAMSEECCSYFYGEDHTPEEFRQMMTSLVERTDSQYSYLNSQCAVDDDDKVKGVMVSYDGGRLRELRKPFIREVQERFGRDFSDMPEETGAGELYIDSAAVLQSERGKGIAKLLFKAAEEKARGLGIGRLGLLVDLANPDAERLYRRIGFEQVGTGTWGGHQLKHMQKTV